MSEEEKNEWCEQGTQASTKQIVLNIVPHIHIHQTSIVPSKIWLKGRMSKLNLKRSSIINGMNSIKNIWNAYYLFKPVHLRNNTKETRQGIPRLWALMCYKIDLIESRCCPQSKSRWQSIGGKVQSLQTSTGIQKHCFWFLSKLRFEPVNRIYHILA